MLTEEKLARLNMLARKAKTETLTPEEQAEQKSLRNEYLENFRKGFRDRLDHIHIAEQE